MTRDWLLTVLTVAVPYLAAGLVAATLLVTDLLTLANRLAGEGRRRAGTARRDAVFAAVGAEAIAAPGDSARP